MFMECRWHLKNTNVNIFFRKSEIFKKLQYHINFYKVCRKCFSLTSCQNVDLELQKIEKGYTKNAIIIFKKNFNIKDVKI